MVDSAALTCRQCGAGLPPPDVSGNSACVYCGTEHRSERTRQVTVEYARSRQDVLEHERVLAAALAERPSWHDCKDAARIPLTEDAVLDLLRQHFADVESISVCPHVPPNRESAARHAYYGQLPPRERILALYETRRSVSALGVTLHEGFVVTSKRVCWRNAFEPPRSIPWSDVQTDHLLLDGQRLFLGDEVDESIVLTEPEVQDACANAFHVLALSGLSALAESPLGSGHLLVSDAQVDFDEESGLVRRPLMLGTTDTEAPVAVRRGATPPPPHTTSFFAYASHAQAQAPDCYCWHCHTPLYESTPQCAYCGAQPSPTGWLRTA
jgi:hypothetical protein